MRTKILLTLFTTAILSFNCKLACSQSNSSDEQMVTMLKKFYTNYITESAGTADEKKLDLIKRQYCTAELLKKIEQQLKTGALDYDPFIMAQDCDKEWLKTLKVKKDAVNNNIFLITYVDNYNKKQITIHLRVIKQKDSYKIDAILVD